MKTFAKYFFGTLVVFPLMMVALAFTSRYIESLGTEFSEAVSTAFKGVGTIVGSLILFGVAAYVMAAIGIAFVASIFGLQYPTRRQTKVGSVQVFEPTREGIILGTIVGLTVIPGIILLITAIA